MIKTRILCSGDDYCVARLQHDVLLVVLASNYLVVIEPKADLLSLFVAQHINAFTSGKVLQPTGLGNKLQNRSGTINREGPFFVYLADEVDIPTVNLAHSNRHLRHIEERL